MSKLGLVSLLCLGAATFSTSAAAETIDAGPSAGVPETLFQRSGRPQGKLGWYAAPTSGFTSFDGRMGYTVGVRSALVVNRTFGFGFAGNLLGTNRTEFNEDDARDVGAYGGAYFQYIFRSSSLVHAFADVTAGAGSWCSRLLDEGCQNKQEFGFVEPTVNVELNVFKWMRVSTGVGYRAALAESNGAGKGLTSRQMSGVVARSSLVFGMF